MEHRDPKAHPRWAHSVENSDQPAPSPEVALGSHKNSVEQPLAEASRVVSPLEGASSRVVWPLVVWPLVVWLKGEVSREGASEAGTAVPNSR